MASLNCVWIFWILIVSNSFASSIIRRHVNLCPHECHCVTNYSNFVTYHCSSLDFVNKFTSKENAQITSLDLSNTSLYTLDKKLKKLVNLEKLNLSQNKLTDLKHFPHFSKLTHLNLRANYIKSFSARNLPSTLKSLDLSHNYIKQLPHDITFLHSLKHLALYSNHFSCNRESLEIRDQLVENKVKFVGHAGCVEPEKLKGQSWFTVVDLDEFFKLQDQEGMQADEPEGSGEDNGSGGYEIISEITELPIEKRVKIVEENTKPSFTEQPKIETTTELENTTLSDFEFSGDGEIDKTDKKADPIESTNTPVIISKEITESGEKHANLGTNIFLGIFLICLATLLIYAVNKHKQKRREARRKRREERRAAPIEMMPKNSSKPSDKQNGNSEGVPLMNGQNGNSKSTEDAETVDPVEKEEPGEYNEPSSAPLLPNSDVKAVKIKASEIPDSVPQTPILVSRSRNSDGSMIVIPKTQ